jgi:sortase A
VLGVALLLLYAGGRVWAERARSNGVEAFHQASIRPPDQSLWSPQRIAEFADSAASAERPEGLLRIPSLQLEVPIYAGTNEIDLTRGAGHIEGTAPLSGTGNIGLAGHRDGFFRKLKDVVIGQAVEIEADGRSYRYHVVDIGIVSPSDVHVLSATDEPSVTLVTCYPFYFVGSAPQRYIIRAQRSGVDDNRGDAS